MRISQADTAKLLAIYFVIMGHVGVSDIFPFLYSFHVQMFFIISGFCYTIKYSSVREYLGWGGVKLLYRVMVPYMFLSFILGNSLSFPDLFRVLWGSDQTVDQVTSTHLWFLPCFFAASIVFQLIFLLIKKPVFRTVTIIILGVMSSLFDYDSSVSIQIRDIVICFTGRIEDTTNRSLELGFPLDFNVAFTGVVLMYIGVIIRKIYDRFTLVDNKKYLILSVLVCMPLGYVLYKMNLEYAPTNWFYPITAMSWAVYGNYILFLAASTFLSIVFFNISCLIDNKYLAKWGQYTLAIYAFHPFLINNLNGIIQAVGFDYLNVYGPLEIYALFIMGISILMIPLIRKFDKRLIGE